MPARLLTAALPLLSVPKVERSVVCISHATGAGGSEVGRLVAERLGFRYVDEELVTHAAVRGGVKAADIADVERRKVWLQRVLEGFAVGGGEAWALGGFGPYGTSESPTSEELRAFIREAIEETAAQGGAVIVAHAASHLLGGRPDTLRVLVTGSPEIRGKRLAEREGLDEPQAAQAVSDGDAGRADYLKRFYDVAEERPTHYDLVLNTDQLSLEQVAALACAAARGGGAATAKPTENQPLS
jgi:cytidylate kinase